MARKAKPLPFKKGMKVVYLSHNYHHGPSVTEAVVTMVTTKDGNPVVYTKHTCMHGYEWKRSFSPVAGMFQENPFPIWMLRPLEDGEIPKLEKIAKHASKLIQEHDSKVSEMQRQVDYEANQWKYAEIERRRLLIPHGLKYRNMVLSRMGFKRPRNGVKVNVKGVIRTVA